MVFQWVAFFVMRGSEVRVLSAAPRQHLSNPDTYLPRFPSGLCVAPLPEIWRSFGWTSRARRCLARLKARLPHCGPSVESNDISYPSDPAVGQSFRAVLGVPIPLLQPSPFVRPAHLPRPHPRIEWRQLQARPFLATASPQGRDAIKLPFRHKARKARRLPISGAFLLASVLYYCSEIRCRISPDLKQFRSQNPRSTHRAW